ncbi:hypothetical protein M8998_06185 [Sphingobacterium sp. lm-10]|uniref:hypothetical protein n=1 Tax=Sphingobacterium sp. lm-10 TaxID=2944904 RepID=UPI00201FE8A9|nr:hypothetical protein [Sphingobacterium sp. lm-10]MCL7987521.1 hypothetical protein [Sphingobacterium sp. lm-10]
MSKFTQPIIRGVVYCIVYTLLSNTNLYAQSKSKVAFELEADPLAYVLNGYSLHAGFNYGSFRSSVGIFAIKQPSFFVNNDNFSVYSSGFDLKTDYLFKNTKGLYAGIQFTYGNDEVKLKSDPQIEQAIKGLNIGLRSGYRFMFGKAENDYKGFYINPWVALIFATNTQDRIIGSETYQPSAVSIFPAVHLGWRF